MKTTIILAFAAAFALAGAAARADVLAHESATIDYSGVELVLTFRASPAPSNYSHPYLTGAPVSMTGQSWALIPKGGNFEVVGGDLLWTLRYGIPERITHDAAAVTISWTAALADDERGNTTATEPTVTIPANGSRVNASGWTHLPLRMDAHEAKRAPDEIFTDSIPTEPKLYAWFDAQEATLFKDLSGTEPATGEGDKIMLWHDSFDVRDFRQDITGPDDRRPTLALNATPNGGRAVRFSGLSQGKAQGLFNNDFGLKASDGPISFMVVMKASGSSSWGAVLHQGVSNDRTHLSIGEPKSGDPDGWRKVEFATAKTQGGNNQNFIQINTQFIPGEWLIVGGTWFGTDHPEFPNRVQLWNLGALVRDAEPNDPNQDAGTWVIGSRADAFHGFNGDIAEIAIFDHPLTDKEAKALTSHLMEKYAIFPRRIHVDSVNGDDDLNGLAPSHTSGDNGPKKTPGAGANLVRGRLGDWLLFRMGSVFEGGPLGGWKIQSGWALYDDGELYSQYPSLYGTYSVVLGMGIMSVDDRPVFKIVHNATGIGGSGSAIDSIALVGLNLYSFERDPDNPAFVNGKTETHGISMTQAAVKNLLVEDCEISFFHQNIALNRLPAGHDLAVRRNIIHHAYHQDSDTQKESVGIYASFENCVRMLIEENAFDHNGWSKYARVPGHVLEKAYPNIYSHNIYIQEEPGSRGWVIRGNFCTYGASHGVQLRPGGVLDSNVFYMNAIHAFTARNAFAEGGSDPSLVWRSLFLDGRSPLYHPPSNFWAGTNLGFQFNGGRDTFLTESIVSMRDRPPPMELGYPAYPSYSKQGWGVGFVARNSSVFAPQEINRAFARNNTIWLAEQIGGTRSGDEPEGVFEEGRVDFNIIAQPDPAIAVRLLDWAINDIGINCDRWLFKHNFYHSDPDPMQQLQWFKKGGSTMPYATWEVEVCDDSATGLAPALYDAGRDLGRYYHEVILGGTGPVKSSEEYIAEILLTRGRGQWAPVQHSAQNVIGWVREGFAPVQGIGYPPGGGHYGAVPY